MQPDHPAVTRVEVILVLLYPLLEVVPSLVTSSEPKIVSFPRL